MLAQIQADGGDVDKFVKRERRYVRHEVHVTDAVDGKLYFREVRDILSL